jgi:phytanoyl-CoA hydroxylase
MINDIFTVPNQNLSLLTSLQSKTFQEQGFLILPRFVATDICEMLIQRMRKLIAEFDPTTVTTVFSTHDQRHAKDAYFLESANNISFFFEEGAVNNAGELICDKTLAINKIGHALHDLDPVFNSFSYLSKIMLLLQDLGCINPILLQSMYICKQPLIGGEVTCHQDATYLYTPDAPVMGLWFALEDATLENGCLWAVPGGHKQGLKSRFIRKEDGSMITETYDSSPWALDAAIPLEVAQGSLIVLHGWVPHMSRVNTSHKSRHAYTLHAMSKTGQFAADNWMQRKS